MNVTMNRSIEVVVISDVRVLYLKNLESLMRTKDRIIFTVIMTTVVRAVSN